MTTPNVNAGTAPTVNGAGSPRIVGRPRVLSHIKGWENAEKFLDAVYYHSEHHTLVRYRSCYYVWNGAHWRYVKDHDVEANVARFFENAYWDRPNAQTGIIEQVDFDLNDSKLRNLMTALRTKTNLYDDVTIPSWIDEHNTTFDHEHLSTSDIIPCRNGLLHVPTRTLYAHTPRLFNTYALQFDYESHAPPPERWLRYLEETHPNDPACVAAIQEIFGYLLTTDNSFQKMFLFIGAKRSGKGTASRVLETLIGPDNLGSASLTSLGESHGAEDIVDKSVVMLPDENTVGRNSHAVVNRLLKITGNDKIDVNPKGKARYTARVPCRFLLLANEIPAFPDRAQALQARMVVIPFDESFLGREDTQLERRLTQEMSGILNWALDGLDRLRARKFFVPPASGQSDLAQLEEISNPHKKFAEECCILDPDAWEYNDLLYQTWVQWCASENVDPGSKVWFGRSMKTLFRKLKSGNAPRDADGHRRKITYGIKIANQLQASWLDGRFYG